MPATYVWTAMADAVAPTITAQSLDAYHVRVIFSEEVVAAEALVASNYTFTGGLSSISVVKESPSVYIVTTSAQSPTSSYTVTASNIHDLAGNLI